MYYGKINHTDIANGPGVRVSLFVSGCRNRCRGCFNPETWIFSYGQLFTTDTLNEIYTALKPDYISGLTVLGGEPLEHENIPTLMRLLKIVKMLYPDKSIWMYTGKLYEDVCKWPILDYVDVLVDGPFVEELNDISLTFKGSSNQRIIDIKESRLAGRVVEVTI